LQVGLAGGPVAAALPAGRLPAVLEGRLVVRVAAVGRNPLHRLEAVAEGMVAVAGHATARPGARPHAAGAGVGRGIEPDGAVGSVGGHLRPPQVMLPRVAWRPRGARRDLPGTQAP